MRKLFLFVSLLFSISSLSQSVPSYVPTDSLVGWWPFNGNANDESGNGHNGTNSGATLTSDRFNSPNNAYHFVGRDQSGNSKITIPHASVFNDTAFTISLWFKKDNSTIPSTPNLLLDGEWLISKSPYVGGGQNVRQFEISIDNNVQNTLTEPFWIVSGIANNSNSAMYKVRSDSIFSSNWYFVVITKSDKNLKLYVNGINEVDSIINDSFYTNTTDFLIGQYWGWTTPAGTTTRDFTGTIDDVGMWNRVLTDCEIKDLYNASSGSCAVINNSDTTICYGDSVTLSTITTYPCNYLPQNLRAGMKAWYPFCGSGQDEVLDNNIISTISLTADRNGKPLSAANIQSSYLELPHKSYHDNDDITFAFWVYNGNTSGRRSYLKKGIYSNAAMEDYYFGIDNNNKFMSGFKGNNSCNAAQGWNTNLSSSSFDNTSNWTHLIFSHVDDTVRIYRNGSEEVKYYLNEPHGFCGAAPLYFGTEWSSYPTLAGGVIDDIGIWNRLLTPNEINQLYNFSIENGFTSVLWSTGDTTSTINVSPSTTTKYWVRQIAGTDTIVDTITVNVLNPTINASTNSICNPGDSVMLWTSKDSSVTQSCGGMPVSLQNGLMAYYPFCGNANDLSGFGNHGTVTNATLTNDRNGNPQSAYYFNGLSKITAPSNYQISDSLNTQVTFSAWINIESYPYTFGPIISKNGPSSRQFEVWVDPNTLGFWGTQFNGSTGYNVPDSTWLHYVVTFDQGIAKYYINSTLVQTATYTTTSLVGNNSILEIGHDSPGVLELFKGHIDDVAIWNRVLSPAHVTILYNNSTSLSNTLWSTGETNDTIWINPTTDTTIWVSSTLGNVTCVDSINIDFLNPEIRSNTLGVCAPGDTAMLWVENESHAITWSTGETSDTIYVTPTLATNYWVQFTSFNGVCSDTIEIDVAEPIEIFGDSLLCKGDSVQLYVVTSNYSIQNDTLYFNDFENTIGSEWSSTNSLSFNGSTNLGNFGNQNLVLSLSNLPQDSLQIDFDLWIHDSWDGNSSGVNGTDSISFYWDQSLLLKTTFNNHLGGTQSYPDVYPMSNPSKTGSALSTSSLCSGQGSTLYRISFSLYNTALNTNLTIRGTPSQSLCDESWSIDNFIITAKNGTMSNGVAWSTGETTDSIWVKPTHTTNYWVSGTDQYGCLSTDSITVFISDIQNSISTQEPSCNSSSDGQAQVNPTGGVSPYTFLWSNGSGSSIANNLSSDTVWVAVTDSIGCSAVDTFFLDQPDSLLITSILTSSYNGFNVSCNGGSDGNVNTTVAGGTMPYYYNWNNNTYTTAGISNVTAGTYFLQVTDTNGCVVNETVSLNEPNPIIISPSINSNYNGYAISCYGESDGSADVNVSGGIPPYAILWSNGAPTSLITNVPSGSYSVSITDANGCMDSAQINLNQPNPLTGTAVVTDASCYGNSDGSLDLTLSGGAGSYNITWSTGDTSLSVYNLPVGWYSYSVLSSNNCELADSVFINQPTPLTIELDTVHPTCINSFDGELNVVAMGGTPGYNYFLNGNAFTGSIQGLGTDSLRILAIDFNNCDTLFAIAMPPVRNPCIFIPNWFSPNGNGEEDVWLIEGFEFGQLKLRIFNVYGQQIYYTESQNYVPWDGTLNGKLLPNGDYYYVIESGNFLSQYTGYVTILR